jgi:hypothetical protein
MSIWLCLYPFLTIIQAEGNEDGPVPAKRAWISSKVIISDSDSDSNEPPVMSTSLGPPAKCIKDTRIAWAPKEGPTMSIHKAHNWLTIQMSHIWAGTNKITDEVAKVNWAISDLLIQIGEMDNALVSATCTH